MALKGNQTDGYNRFLTGISQSVVVEGQKSKSVEVESSGLRALYKDQARSYSAPMTPHWYRLNSSPLANGTYSRLPNYFIRKGCSV